MSGMASSTKKSEKSESAKGRSARSAAVGLGWFSIGLGLAELLAPRAVARLVGIRARPRARGLLRGCGVRELAVGVGLLASRRPAPWLWARVAGDVLDMGLLAAGGARASRRDDGARLLGALGGLAGVTALDAACAVAASSDGRARDAAPVSRSVTIARPPEEVYRFWRDLRNVPRFMAAIESVEIIDALTSRWTARGPVGPVVHWQAIIVEDEPSARLGWESIEGSDVRTMGLVRFAPAPGDRGTEVHVELRYGPPHGAAARAASFLWRPAAALALENDLRRFKQLLETGHIVHSDASVHPGRHAARPSSRSVDAEGGAL